MATSRNEQLRQQRFQAAALRARQMSGVGSQGSQWSNQQQYLPTAGMGPQQANPSYGQTSGVGTTYAEPSSAQTSFGNSISQVGQQAPYSGPSFGDLFSAQQRVQQPNLNQGYIPPMQGGASLGPQPQTSVPQAGASLGPQQSPQASGPANWGSNAAQRINQSGVGKSPRNVPAPNVNMGRSTV